MATRKANKQAEQVLDLTGLDPLDANETALDQILAEVEDSDDSKLQVYRQHQTAHDLEWLFDCGVSDYTLDKLREYLRDAYGAGQFRVHVRVGGRFIKNFALKIGGRLQPPALPAHAALDGPLQKLIETQAEQTRALQQQLQAVLRQQQQAQGGGMKDFLQFAMVMKSLGLTGGGGGGRGNGLEDLEQMLQVMDALEQRAEDRVNGKANANPDNWIDVINKGIDGFVDVFGHRTRPAAPRALPGKPQPATANPAGAAAAAPAVSQESEKMNSMVTMLLRARAAEIRTLLNAAQAQQDPAAYVEMTLAAVPDIVSDEMLVTALQHPQALAVAIQWVPDLAPHSAWFKQLADLLVDTLTAEGADSGTDDGLPGADTGKTAGAGDASTQ